MRKFNKDNLGDVYSVQEFFDIAEAGGYNPWDGSGYPAKYVDGILMEDTDQSCWNYKHGGFTHVVWYNK